MNPDVNELLAYISRLETALDLAVERAEADHDLDFAQKLVDTSEGKAE